MPSNYEKRSNIDKDILSWLTLQSLIVIIVAIGSFVFVEISSNILTGNRIIGEVFLHALGMIIPMCCLLGALNFHLSKHSYRIISNLTNGVEKIANGDFSTRLDEKNAGVFTNIYANFNKMGAELENVQVLRNDFINSYSHEFKTPINSINGFATLLLKKNVTEEEKEQYLKIIVDESARLAALANSTLLLSNLDSQQIVTDKRSYSLDEQLRQCMIMLSSDWNAKDITFSGEFAEITYHGNTELMQHLWLNLLNNAIKYTPKHGEITMSLIERDNTVIVEISDTGIGMSEEVVSHIFEKYYQEADANTRQGLGLGLSIVKRIIELCDGTIEVTSEKNKGSTFIVTLPNA